MPDETKTRKCKCGAPLTQPRQKKCKMCVEMGARVHGNGARTASIMRLHHKRYGGETDA